MQIVSKAARREIVEALKTRYYQASKFEKGRILAEFTTVSGYHRKHAIRLLSSEILGIDPDNDGAFISDTLASYCQQAGVAFTRSRPRKRFNRIR